MVYFEISVSVCLCVSVFFELQRHKKQKSRFFFSCLAVEVSVCFLTRVWGRVKHNFGRPCTELRDELGCH